MKRLFVGWSSRLRGLTVRERCAFLFHNAFRLDSVAIHPVQNLARSFGTHRGPVSIHRIALSNRISLAQNALQLLKIDLHPTIDLPNQRGIDPLADELRLKEITFGKGALDLTAIHLPNPHPTVGRKFFFHAVTAWFHRITLSNRISLAQNTSIQPLRLREAY